MVCYVATGIGLPQALQNLASGSFSVLQTPQIGGAATGLPH
jgi:hypothetical protein